MLNGIKKTAYFFLMLFSTVYPQGSYVLEPSEAILRKSGVEPALTPKELEMTRIKIDPLENQINYTNLAVIGAITLSSGVAIHIYQKNTWWADQSATFKIVNDWEYALWIDKIGHFYGTHLLAHAFSSAFEGSGIRNENSVIYSAAAAFAFEMYVEIEDGFGKNWGFSPGDAGADLLGALYFLGQYYYPVLKNFQPRISYWPSEDLLNPPAPGDRKRLHRANNVTDDYAGQKYWLAFRMKNLLPGNWAKYWPSFLMISVGTGLKDWNGYGKGQRELYIALDLDAEELPLHGQFWQFVKNTLNYIHFPMPGIRITPDAAFLAFVY